MEHIMLTIINCTDYYKLNKVNRGQILELQNFTSVNNIYKIKDVDICTKLKIYMYQIFLGKISGKTQSKKPTAIMKLQKNLCKKYT